jgi:hypothetical protein
MFVSLNQTDRKNFYPTPAHLISKMLGKVQYLHALTSILEPSAGMGDIAIAIEGRNSYSSKKVSVDCIEIDPNMQHILRGEKLRVIHDDFLTFNAYKKYELIIMNPPFDCGDKHLLKAIDIQKRGGQIVCLLNAETLLNPCTNTRKELVQKLTELEADIEFLDDCFTTNDTVRKTTVQVAMVYINIKEEKVIKDESFIFNELKQAKEIEIDVDDPTAITAKTGFLEQMVEQYEFEVKGTLRLIREFESFKPYMMNRFNDKCSHSILSLSVYGDRGYTEGVNVNEYLKIVRLKYWNALFNNPQFTSMLTSDLLSDFRKNIEKMADYDFTMFNIKSIQLEMSKNMLDGVEATIIRLFDELSHKISYWDEGCPNIHYYNGWKTNKSYIVNKKVIIPYTAYIKQSYTYKNGEREYYSYFGGNGIEKLKDMEKVFNYLDGGLTEHVDIENVLRKAAESDQTRKIPLKYFTVTFYKKGTCHIEFNNMDLLKKLNIYGSQRKGWLPPSYGKKKYNEMTQEEKTVIDEFEGEKEYNKVMMNKGYFLPDNSSLLMLGMGERESA